jgi:hypothetical protein
MLFTRGPFVSGDHQTGLGSDDREVEILCS